MKKSSNLLRNTIISILAVLIGAALFLWKILTSSQQPAGEADQYQENDQ